MAPTLGWPRQSWDVLRRDGGNQTTNTLAKEYYELIHGLRDALGNLAGSGGRSVADKLTDWVSVKDYGALCDGVHDDTQAFYDAFATGKPAIFIPGCSSTYRCSQLVVPNTVRRVYGDGKAASVIEGIGSIPTALFIAADSTNLQIENLGFMLASGTYTTQTVILIGRITGLLLQNIAATGSYGGIHLSDCLKTLAFNCDSIDPMGFGLLADGSLSNNVVFHDCHHSGFSSGHGMQIAAGVNMHILESSSENCLGFGCNIYQATQSSIQLCKTKNTGYEGINVDSSPESKVFLNISEWTTSPSQSIEFGMSMYGNTDTCNFSQFIGNTVLNCSKSGIAIDGGGDGVGGCIISDNIVINPNAFNVGTTDYSSGIVVYGPNATDNTISNNLLFANNGFMVNGIAEWNNIGPPNRNRIYGNRIIGNSGAKVILLGALSTTDETIDFVPVVTPSAGAITDYDVEAAFSSAGNKCYYRIDVTDNTNGTGSGSIQVTLPYTAVVDGNGAAAVFAGRELTGGLMLQGIVTASAISILYADNTYPGFDGAQLFVSGWFEIDGL